MSRFTPIPICLFILAFLVLAVSEYAQDGSPDDFKVDGLDFSQRAKADGPTATIKGRVVYEDTSRPLRYGTIGLKLIGGSNTTDFVKTDGEGNFEIRNVDPGTYLPVIRVEGVLGPESLENFRILKNADPPVIVFQEISVPGPGEYQIDIRAKRGATLSGTVRYADGEIAVGLNVRAILLFGDRKQGKAVNVAGNVSTDTDGSGFYRFTGLLPGDYIIQVVEPAPHKYAKVSNYGKREVPPIYSPINILKTYAPSALNALDADVIRLARGGERKSVNITIPDKRLHSVSGIVISKSTGKPLTDFNVTFNPVSEHPEFVRGSGSAFELVLAQNSYSSGNRDDLTKDEGRFEIRNLPRGKYKLSFSQTQRYGYNSVSDRKDDVKVYPPVEKEVEIGETDLTGLIIEVPDGGGFSGLVATEDESELPSYFRSLYVGDRDQGGTFKPADFPDSGENGNLPAGSRFFRVNGLKKGKYRFSLSSEDYYIRSISVGGRDVTYEPIEIAPGGSFDDVLIVLATDAGKVKGQVSNLPADKTASSWEGVIFLREGGTGEFSDRLEFAPVGRGSSFERALPPGTYRYAYWVPGRNGDQGEAAFRQRAERALRGAPTVTVKARESVNINVRYRPLD